MRFRKALGATLLALAMAFPGGHGVAADLAGTTSAPATMEAVDESLLRAYVARRAVLYQIRAAFDVMPPDEIEAQLLADALNAGITGLANAEAEVDRDLLSEGNYLLVSLKYLIQAGGAAWPSDRPASNYVNDALVRIAALQEELSRAVEERTDPLPIMVEANGILALTEGLAEPLDEIDFFAGRDAIVDKVFDQLSADA